MPRFLLWNMDAGRDVDDERRPFGQLLAGLAFHHAIDVLLLVECSIPTARLLPHFQGEPSYHMIPGPDRFRVLARFPPAYMEPINAPLLSNRVGLWHLALPLQKDAILALVHGLDRRNNGTAKRELFLSQVVSQVSWAEKKFGHQRTIVAGDFNANPFEPELGSTSGMHAVMTRDLASPKPRRLLGQEYGFFYNPMWNLYGDRQDGQPAGTYYFDGGQPHEWYWHLLDQVVVRPVLIPRLPLTSLRILTAGPSGNLATPSGRPDRKKGSDHFPLVFELELRSDQEGAFNEQGSWPEFDVAALATPKKIIEQAGAGLEKKTKGIIKFHLGGTRISEGFASLDFSLYSPTLEYMYPFLKVRFPMVDLYPVELVADKLPDTLRAANEEELLGMLGKVFQSASTIDTIQKLIALS